MFKRRALKTTLDASSSPRCVMCGAEVAVDVNGFCPLGHFVGTPQASHAAVDSFPEPARRAEPEPGAVFTEPTIALPVLDEAGPAAAPTVPLPVVEDPVPLYTGALIDEAVEPEPLDSFAELFGAAAPADAEASADDAFVPASFEPYSSTDIGAEAQHALDELLAHGHIFSPDPETEAAFSALDVPAEQLLGEDEPVDAYETGFESIAPPDDEVDDAVAARRRAAGLLGGSVLTLAMLAASVAVLPF